MELRVFARRLLETESLSEKLQLPESPVDFSDNDRGEPEFFVKPGRPSRLDFVHGRKVKIPPLEGMKDPSQRVRILHAFANHELQAAELFAWAILAFPNADPLFRRGLLMILRDEQRHCASYIDRIRAFGVEFGDFLITGYFWKKISQVSTPLNFICFMGLTFENANLDFAQDYAQAARLVGDLETAELIEEVHRDEVGHVAFAWRWLNKFKKENSSAWETYLENVEYPVGPARARGKNFYTNCREEAGIDVDFIAELEKITPLRPSGEPR